MTGGEPGTRAGSELGHYRLRRLIGYGTMGEVYEAEDTVKDRIIALKLLSTTLSSDPAFRDRLHQEARTAGRLQEPHVVPIHDYGEIDGHLFLDMRLIEGSDLSAVLRDCGALPAGRAVKIIRQAAAALDAAHAAGVIHRDIKPANLLVTDDDFVYLVDFGIASAVGSRASSLQPQTLEGTWNYSAPELFTDGEPGPGIDVYALTSVLYECLTGVPPYRADDLKGLIAAHLHEPIPRPSRRSPDIPIALDAVIATGMAKRPADRYQSAGELGRAAKEALAPPVQHRPPSPSAPAARVLAPPRPDWPSATPLPRPPAPPPGPVPRRLTHSSAAPPAGASVAGPQGVEASRPSVAQPLPQPVVLTYSPHDSTTPLWHKHKRPLIGVAAAGAVALLAGLLLHRSPEPSEPQEAAPPTSALTSESPAAEPVEVVRLRTFLPPGQPLDSCRSFIASSHAVAEVRCTANTDPGGPTSAIYTMYADRAALRAAFDALVRSSSAVTCPGQIQSPGPWRHGTTPPGKSDGMLMCSIGRGGVSEVSWTNDASLVLSHGQVDASPTGLERLFAWWSSHS
ncbi:serine/threonine-protein kinase [Mycolicibacter sinensis]|uniref:non-specific serine/threonine protein kinase n=1 Tax=Mycolicibacter sinensis (strain JDM601) TaxID=875328 RepID=A0A1A2XV86_MYCSD|nr:serine/threonine-protein kinase [Mycolicibacter sinensis]OBI29063.1 hypothetical protein A5710_22705 [Mycolicibacter sinensis]